MQTLREEIWTERKNVNNAGLVEFTGLDQRVTVGGRFVLDFAPENRTCGNMFPSFYSLTHGFVVRYHQHKVRGVLLCSSLCALVEARVYVYESAYTTISATSRCTLEHTPACWFPLSYPCATLP